VPLSYADQYYDLRAHVELVRERLEPTADFSKTAAPAE